MLRFPISAKLAVAFAAVVTAISATFVGLADRALRDANAERATALREARVAEQTRRSIVAAAHIGATTRAALSGTESGRLTDALGSLARADPEVRYVAIADDLGSVVARSDLPVEAVLKRNERIDVPAEVTTRQVTVAGESILEVVGPLRESDRGGRVIGALQIGWSLRRLDEDLDAIAADEGRDIDRAKSLMIFAGLGAVAAGMFAGFIGSMALGRPIRRLAKTARAISEGDHSARADVRTRDEIGDLAATMNQMATHIEGLLDESRAKGEIERELSVAREIQQALLPPRGSIEKSGVHLSGLVESASQCGGDWWAVTDLTRSRTLVLVGDVTGHGLPSAMLTATARSCLDTVRQLTQGDFRVGHLLKILDQLLREGVGAGFHMTCFASIVDPLEHTITYANAGHNQPFLLRKAEGGWRQGRLAGRGNRLGDADGYAFIEHTVTTAEDDLLCWYSDGLIEARSGEDREFGVRRLRQALLKNAAAPPDEALTAVMARLDAFMPGQPLLDDVTCVVGRITA